MMFNFGIRAYAPAFLLMREPTFDASAYIDEFDKVMGERGAFLYIMKGNGVTYFRYMGKW